MKALNILGIIASVAIMWLAYYFIEEINSSRSQMYFYSYTLDYSDERPDVIVTQKAGLVMLGFSTFFILQCIFNLVNVKTPTAKAVAIIGTSLLTLGFGWNLLMLNKPTHISFDEGGQMWFFAGVMMIIFSSIFLVQMTKKYRRRNLENDILDDDII